MALVVKSNMSAINTRNLLNKNSNEMAKSLAKLSSGMKINSAADDASGYVISERMRGQIRGLEQDICNAQYAGSMLKVAEGAVSSTVEILKTLKEKAINAANDSNTDADRATIQKEFEQSIDQINDNAMVTYNGKYMLDGASTIGGVASAQESVREFMGSLNTTSKSGMAALDEAVFAASGGLFGSAQALIDSYIGDMNANSGTSIEQQKAFLKEYCGIDLDNEDTGAITGHDAGGDTVLTAESVVPETGPVSSWTAPTSGSTTFNGLTLNWTTTNDDNQAFIVKALNSEWMTSALNLIADSFDMSFEDSGATVRTIDLIFENNSGSNALAYVTNWSAGGQANRLTLTFNMAYYSNLNPNDVNGSDLSSGQTQLDRVLAHELTHAVMAANVNNFNDLPAYIKEGMAELVHGIDDQRAASIRQMVDTSNADAIKSALETGDATAGNVSIGTAGGESAYALGYVLLRYMGKQSSGGNGALTSTSDGDSYSFNYKLTDKAFTFQLGTKANQSIRMGFADMRAKSLKLENAKKERISVTTRENAVKSLGVLDYAIAKALDQQTTIGAMQSRLEHTINNLTVALENVQRSESTIRDVDMAKEMTEYTKYKVLTQASQSMLQQSYQMSQGALNTITGQNTQSVSTIEKKSAVEAQYNLQKNDSALGKSLQKISSGMKINSAGDDASGYAIAKRLEIQVRGLDQDIQNVRNGKNLVKVAEGGIQQIIDNLRQMKELAINSANDSNTDQDRAVLQKDFNQHMETIDDIAATTNYNGRLLLTGDWARLQKRTLVEEDDSGGARGANAVTPTGFPAGSVTTISGSAPYAITTGGIYEIDAGYTGTISVDTTDAVMIQQSSSTALSGVNITATAAGSNLWINSLNLTGSTASTISFTGSGNKLTLLGSSRITQGNGNAAAVNIGDGLTVDGNGSSLTINCSQSLGAGIGTDASSTNSSAALQIVDANLNITMHSNDSGSAVGSGKSGKIGNITIENSTITAQGGYFAAIGSGSQRASCGDITIKTSTITENYSIDTCIGSGFSNSSCGNIVIEDSVVHFSNSDSAGIGSGDGGSTCGDIRVSNSEIVGSSNHGAGIGSGRNGSTAGNVVVNKGTYVKHTSLDGAAIGSGEEGHVGTIDLTTSVIRLLDPSGAYQAPDHVIPGVGHGRGGTAGDTAGVKLTNDDEDTDYYVDGIPLVIQHGTKANQNLHIYIENMSTGALGLSQIDKITGEKTYVSIASRESAQALLTQGNKRTGDPPPGTMPETPGILDSALEYALGQATYMGAYQQRLESIDNYLVISNENTLASLSRMRDADIAREMTEYAKHNLLTQVAQAMLAQANQKRELVLSLL
ncbi:Flagellin FlgL [Selenomonas sp. KH1T6]|nr:Flagellin FlgL [Selenomonas ruminantium]